MLIVPKEKLSSVSNTHLSQYASVLEFETTHIIAEPMGEDDGESTYVFPFRNIGKDTLTISRIVSTCSCVTALCEDKYVLPGETSGIVLRYNPKGHPGRFERRVFIYVCDDKVPSAVLKLSVDVERGKNLSGLYPVSMGNIRLRRSEVHFTKGVKAVERCVFVNVTDKALNVECEKSMLPSCLTFNVEPQVVQSGQEGEIIIQYDPDKGGERERMPVILRGMAVPPSQSSITVILKMNK